MNTKIRHIASVFLAAAFGVAFTACDDWTEPESSDINYATVDKSENYPAYLEALRKYRSTEHKKVYAWVDYPAEGPTNQSHRMTSLPDSIDVMVLSVPAGIHPTVKSDMQKVRKDKGMKVIYQIDFDAINSDYTALCENLAAQRTALEAEYAAREDKDEENVINELNEKLAALKTPDIEDYILENLTSGLSYAKAQDMDGVMFAFNGKATLHLTTAELAEYNARQALFLGAAADWHRRNPDMAYDFLGYPQNITDKTILGEFRMIFIRQGLDATNPYFYSFCHTQARVEGVPAERLGMMTTFTSADPVDVTTGVFSDGTLALTGFAQWVANADIAGVGIKNVQNDYFNSGTSYPNIRAVINAANPVIR